LSNFRLAQALSAVCLSLVFPASVIAQKAVSVSGPVPAAVSAPAATESSAAASVAGTEGVSAEGAFVTGFNFSLTTASQHDSIIAWSNSWTPDFSYAYNKHFGGDFSFPFYTYLDTLVASGSPLKPTDSMITIHNVIGDASATVHYAASPSFMDYVLTVTGGFPIGNKQYDLSSTQYTYNITNHFDTSLGIFSPEIEIGEGDSSSLANHRVLKSTIVVGPLAFFTAGTAVELPFNLTFTADAYEQLPLQNMDTFKTVKNLKKGLTTVQTGSGPAEDNGFETNLDIPITSHFTLSGIYDRSLRQHEDTVGFALTYLLRVPKAAAKSAAK
jgi:hypothetical protein